MLVEKCRYFLAPVVLRLSSKPTSITMPNWHSSATGAIYYHTDWPVRSLKELPGLVWTRVMNQPPSWHQSRALSVAVVNSAALARQALPMHTLPVQLQEPVLLPFMRWPTGHATATKKTTVFTPNTPSTPLYSMQKIPSREAFMVLGALCTSISKPLWQSCRGYTWAETHHWGVLQILTPCRSVIKSHDNEISNISSQKWCHEKGISGNEVASEVAPNQ